MINKDYILRINKVKNYIEDNLNSSLSLQEMASVANFSTYHFHRIFLSIVGETPVQYQRRKRLELSAKNLYQTETTIKEVSYKYGYASPAVYSRDFKKHFGKSPKDLRNNLLSRLRFSNDIIIELKTIKPFSYAYRTIVGFNNIIPEFLKLRKEISKNKFSIGSMVEYIYDNQYITSKDKCRYDLGFVVQEHNSNSYSLNISSEQLYAIYNLKGSTDKIDDSFDKIYSWIIKSEYEPEHLPLLIFFNKVFSLKPLFPIDYTNANICVPIKKQELQT